MTCKFSNGMYRVEIEYLIMSIYQTFVIPLLSEKYPSLHNHTICMHAKGGDGNKYLGEYRLCLLEILFPLLICYQNNSKFQSYKEFTQNSTLRVTFNFHQLQKTYLISY